jgi:hypothetical protein
VASSLKSAAVEQLQLSQGPAASESGAAYNSTMLDVGQKHPRDWILDTVLGAHGYALSDSSTAAAKQQVPQALEQERRLGG